MALLNLDAASPHERLALLSEIVSRQIIEECVTEVGDRPASGNLRGEELGELGLIEIAGANVRAHRTRAHVARSPFPFYLVSVQLAGTNAFRWRERDMTVARGDIFVVDTLHAYEVDGERPFRQLVARLPKPWLDARVARPDLVPGTRLRQEQPVTRMIAHYLASGFGMANALSESTAAIFAEQLVDLLAHAFNDSPPRELIPSRAWREALFLRACRMIRLHSGEADLTPHRIARALGVSARLLQKIFAEHDETVMGHAWEERVGSAARLLADPQAAGRSITEIAYSCGFNDSAHFSRAFAARVGMPPSQWRRQGPRPAAKGGRR